MSNTSARLNLVVLRSSDLDRASVFYSKLGLQLTKHRHGNGPEHYAASFGGTVFELYPLGKGPSTAGVRIGFEVQQVEQIVDGLIQIGAEVISPLAQSEWGQRAVLKDFDGHVVELVGRLLQVQFI